MGASRGRTASAGYARGFPGGKGLPDIVGGVSAAGVRLGAGGSGVYPAASGTVANGCGLETHCLTHWQNGYMLGCINPDFPLENFQGLKTGENLTGRSKLFD
jgi:hypothetical protein